MMRMRPYPAVAGAVVLEATMAEWRTVRRRLAVMQTTLAREVVPAGDDRGIVASTPVSRAEALQIVGLIADLREQTELLDQLRQTQGTTAAPNAVPPARTEDTMPAEATDEPAAPDAGAGGGGTAAGAGRRPTRGARDA
jgi:hypothetical protein